MGQAMKILKQITKLKELVSQTKSKTLQESTAPVPGIHAICWLRCSQNVFLLLIYLYRNSFKWINKWESDLFWFEWLQYHFDQSHCLFKQQWQLLYWIWLGKHFKHSHCLFQQQWQLLHWICLWKQFFKEWWSTIHKQCFGFCNAVDKNANQAPISTPCSTDSQAGKVESIHLM